MALTAAEMTVLGLIVERPMHGYDVERVIESRGIRQWTDIGFSSIYYLLDRLERRGLVDSAEVRADSRSRRMFRATAEGRRAAVDGALALIAESSPAPQPVLVGIANLSLLDEEAYVDALRARAASLEARIGSVEAAEQAQGPLPPAAREVFSYSLRLMRAERSWLASRVQEPT